MMQDARVGGTGESQQGAWAVDRGRGGGGVVVVWGGGGGGAQGLHMRHQTLRLHLLTLGHWYTPAVGRDSAPTRASSWREAYATLTPPSHGARTLRTSPASAGGGGRASDAVAKSHGARPAFL